MICTLDEHEAIGGVLQGLSAALEGVDYEVLVVDDSRDERTAQAVLGRAAHDPAVRLLRRRDGRGLASAAIAGWDAARGRYLAVMDGDGQHDPGLIAALLAQLRGGARDVAVASRYLGGCGSGLGRVRHAMSRGATWLTLGMLGVRLADPMSGCFMMTRAWFAQVRPRLSGLGFKILVDVVASGDRRPRTAQLPARLGERHGGASKMDARVVFDLLSLLVEKRSHGWIPARMTQFFLVGVSGLGVHMAVVAALLALAWPFWAAQMLAIMLAMTSNFLLNNVLTFRDKRLRGARLLSGLLMFYLACLGGGFINEAVALGGNALGLHWSLSAAFGALAAAFWNYHVSKRTAWSETVNVATVEEAIIDGSGAIVSKPV